MTEKGADKQSATESRNDRKAKERERLRVDHPDETLGWFKFWIKDLALLLVIFYGWIPVFAVIVALFRGWPIGETLMDWIPFSLSLGMFFVVAAGLMAATAKVLSRFKFRYMRVDVIQAIVTAICFISMFWLSRWGGEELLVEPLVEVITGRKRPTEQMVRRPVRQQPEEIKDPKLRRLKELEKKHRAFEALLVDLQHECARAKLRGDEHTVKRLLGAMEYVKEELRKLSWQIKSLRAAIKKESRKK